MLVVAESYAETASSVPNVIAGVIVYPVGHGEGDAVEEHIAREALVCLGGHNDHTHIIGLPGGKHDDFPVAVMEVDIVEIVTERAGSAANLSCDHLSVGRVAGKHDGVGSVAERLAVFVLHISDLYSKLGKRLLEYCG